MVPRFLITCGLLALLGCAHAAHGSILGTRGSLLDSPYCQQRCHASGNNTYLGLDPLSSYARPPSSVSIQVLKDANTGQIKRVFFSGTAVEAGAALLDFMNTELGYRPTTPIENCWATAQILLSRGLSQDGSGETLVRYGALYRKVTCRRYGERTIYSLGKTGF